MSLYGFINKDVKMSVWSGGYGFNVYICRYKVCGGSMRGSEKSLNTVMLQFITKASERYSVAEEVQMALEGGCRWIQLSGDGFGDKETSMRESLGEIVAMCQEHEAFLIIEGNVDLVEESKVHGLFLRDCSRDTVMSARERLGANAVIGVYARNVAEVKHLVGLDVDYVIVPVAEDCTDKGAFYRSIAGGMMDANIDFHVVAAGSFAPSDYMTLLEAGCAGVAVSDSIADADDPVAATVEILEALDAARTAVNNRLV